MLIAENLHNLTNLANFQSVDKLMRRIFLFFFALFLCAALAPASVDRVLDELSKVQQFRGVAVSPDGARVAWVQDVSHGGSAIYVSELNSPSAKLRRITAECNRTACSEHSPAWSPDGRQLAFLSDREKKGQLQIYVTEVGEVLQGS